MILAKIIFLIFNLCGLTFLLLSIIAGDIVLFLITLLFAMAGGLVAWQAKLDFRHFFKC